jgi:IS30 family transposase
VPLLHSKSVLMERRKVAKSEKQYLRGTIHNLSLSRWTDQEIVDYLRDEKQIDIARSTVNSIKNQIEKQAEKWYFELRESRYKYVASYKERIDSLFSVQKKLH